MQVSEPSNLALKESSPFDEIERLKQKSAASKTRLWKAVFDGDYSRELYMTVHAKTVDEAIQKVRRQTNVKGLELRTIQELDFYSSDPLGPPRRIS